MCVHHHLKKKIARRQCEDAFRHPGELSIRGGALRVYNYHRRYLSKLFTASKAKRTPPFAAAKWLCQRRTTSSKQYHARYGTCRNKSRAELAGPLIVSDAFCACAKCLEFKYSKCLVQRHVGVARTVQVPRKKGGTSAVPQALALPAFVAEIKKGET